MKAFVVRFDNKIRENFIPVSSISRDLFQQETWRRNQIVEVHFSDEIIGFVATNAGQLHANMLKAMRYVEEVPFAVEKRIQNEKAL